MRLNLVNLQTDINTRLLEQQGKMEKELQVDEQGGLQIPAKVLQEWGIAPGTKLLMNKDPGGILLRRSDPFLAKVYVFLTQVRNSFII
jgi:bifunctional DNA-binding transcriptional regulator/antitoxin component of YhaV-PrlF toxin-antitoxin module